MMKNLILYILSFLAGVSVTFLLTDYFIESESSNFIDEQIKIQELISKDAFIHYPLSSSNFNQINYNSFVAKAYEARLIDVYNYNRAASVANIRLCINFEEANDIENAKRHCKWAKTHFSKWNTEMKFESFKRSNLELKSKIKGSENLK